MESKNMQFRSLLFVPGARPDRFDKAAASGADAVCIDLEDAVAATNKDMARREALDYLSKPQGGAAIGLRLNALNHIDGLRDAVALYESNAKPAFVLLPKVLNPEPVIQIRKVLSEKSVPVWALMETPEALQTISELACSIGEEGGVMFGGADFSASIGSDMGWDALYHARASIVASAAVGGCQAMDVPYLDVPDIDGMTAETERVKTMGFTGRACIHPSQVEAVNKVFTPSPEQVAEAKRTLDAYEESKGVMLLDGKLVEKPVLAAARRVIALATLAEKS